jgi:hypothetical protein
MIPCQPELPSLTAECKLAARSEFRSPIPPHPSPLPEERGHRRPRVRQFRAPRDVSAQTSGLPPHEPRFARELPTILPLPFRRGEGRGEGSDWWFRGTKRVSMSGRSRPKGEGRGEGEQSAPISRRPPCCRRLSKPEPLDRLPAKLAASISAHAASFGFRLSAFLRPSVFDLRPSPLPCFHTS